MLAVAAGLPLAGPARAAQTDIPAVGSTIPLSQAKVVPGAGTGQTVYVSTKGSDTNNGLSAQTPLKSLQKAIAMVGPGGTIELMGGTYSGGVVISHSGTPDAWITMEPYQGQKVIIDGAGTGDGVLFRNSATAPAYWVLRGLAIANAQDVDVRISVADVRLIDNNIYGSSHDLVKLTQGADNVVLYGNNIHNNNAAPGSNAQGVDVVGSRNVLIAHNTVSNIASIGLYCEGNAANVTFEGNTLNNIYSRGIMLGGSSSTQNLEPGKTYESYNSIIKNNVITNTQSACLSESSSYGAYIENNSCYNTAIDRQGAILVSNEAINGQAGTDVEIRNNIIENFSLRPMVLIAPGAMTEDNTLKIDNNLYFDSAGVTFQWDDRGIYRATIASWRQETGFDIYSIVADPLFTDLSKLTVSKKSPALHAGIPLPTVRHDFNGVERPSDQATTLGAYQVNG